MRLTQKVIAAVTKSLLASSATTDRLDVDAEVFQKLVLEELGLTLGEAHELNRLSVKASLYAPLQSMSGNLDYSIYVPQGRTYGYEYFRVKLNGPILSSRVVNQKVMQDLIQELKPAKPSVDYGVALTAFSTVEEALLAYPELKPAFETVFGKGSV